MCKNRIAILKHFNPNHEIHGLYGGNASEFDHFRDQLTNQLASVEMTRSDNPEWKWLHPDLSLKHWYQSHGQNLDFDFLYDFEWDILALDSLDNIYPEIDDDTIALSALTELSQVKDSWDWTSVEPDATSYRQFRAMLSSSYNIGEQKFASLGPGPYLSRKFLETFSAEPDCDLVISEISYPAYAEALGFKLISTGFFPDWHDDDTQNRYFNCHDHEIKIATVIEELNKPDGRRIFHPIKTTVKLEQFI